MRIKTVVEHPVSEEITQKELGNQCLCACVTMHVDNFI